MTEAGKADKSKRPTILVVDDTPDNITVINEMLRDTYRIKAATSGEAALRIARGEDQPALILLDVMMPVMDGYEVCAALRDDPYTSSIPVIFQTARTDPDDEVKGFSLGAVDYITKPINPNRLKARVATQLELAMARKRLEQQNQELVEAAKLREDVEGITRHDLKSPLNAIVGVPQLLLATCEFTESQRELVQMIEQAGQRMLEMINLSLDLFKMERGKYVLNPEEVNITRVTADILNEVSLVASKKRVELFLRVNGADATRDTVVAVAGEALLCHSMMGNLCKNAVEASPDGSPLEVDIRPGVSADGLPVVPVAVSNAGEVPEQIRTNFFGKYVTAGKRNGTGLGAYSARLIAETQKGAIALDSSRPGHTTITVTLPAWQG